MFTENPESEVLETLSKKFISSNSHERIYVVLQMVDELINLGKYASALELTDIALDFERDFHESDRHPHIGIVLHYGALCLWNMAEIDAAIGQLEESLEYTTNLPSDELLERMGTLASWFYQASDLRSTIRTKIEIIRFHEMESNFLMMGSELLNLAHVYFEEANFLESAATAENAIAQFSKCKDHLKLALSEAIYGASLAEVGHLEKGLACTRRALSDIELVEGRNHNQVRALYFHGRALALSDDYLDAKHVFLRARAILERYPNDFDITIKADVEKELSRIFRFLNQ